MTGEGPTDAEFIDVDGLSLSFEEYERLKTLQHGDRFRELAYSDRIYLVVGAGGETGKAARRRTVTDELDRRAGATAIRLEEFELTSEDLALWATAFELLCDRATHIVVVIEDYEGGYVWELGYLFQQSLRERVWVLKRDHGTAGANRKRYDNGMAASHVRLLENATRTLRWEAEDDLVDRLDELP